MLFKTTLDVRIQPTSPNSYLSYNLNLQFCYKSVHLYESVHMGRFMLKQVCRSLLLSYQKKARPPPAQPSFLFAWHRIVLCCRHWLYMNVSWLHTKRRIGWAGPIQTHTELRKLLREPGEPFRHMAPSCPLGLCLCSHNGSTWSYTTDTL